MLLQQYAMYIISIARKRALIVENWRHGCVIDINRNACAVRVLRYQYDYIDYRRDV